MFKLDEARAAQIRQRETTPPPPVHYDPEWEHARTRGTGYYKLDAHDEARRESQLTDLNTERKNQSCT